MVTRDWLSGRVFRYGSPDWAPPCQQKHGRRAAAHFTRTALPMFSRFPGRLGSSLLVLSVPVLNSDITVITAMILEIVRQIGKYTARKTHQKLRFCSQPIPGGLISCASRVNFPSKCCGSTQGLSARPRRQFCYCDTLKREQQSAWLSVHAAQPGNRPRMRSTNKLGEFITNLGMETPSSIGQGRNVAVCTIFTQRSDR